MAEPNSVVTITPAKTPAELDVFRTLVRGFAGWAMATFHPGEVDPPPALAKMEEELALLPGKYAAPDGALLLAFIDGQPAGCIAGFRNDPRSMEVTRLWVTPESRGCRVGESLVQHLLNAARSAGYERIVLRSHKELKAAHHIYRSAGFSDVDGAGIFPTFQDFELAMTFDPI